jgi:hypothetical protein
MNNNQDDAVFIFGLLSCRPADSQLININKYHLPHIYVLPPDDGLLIRPKHVEV